VTAQIWAAGATPISDIPHLGDTPSDVPRNVDCIGSIGATHCAPADTSYATRRILYPFFVKELCLSLGLSSFLANMPPKKASDLTNDEFRLLVIAARLLAALRKWAERPLSPNEQATWDIRASEELVRPHYPLHGLSIS
jgi:hypothetical protein